MATNDVSESDIMWGFGVQKAGSDSEGDNNSISEDQDGNKIINLKDSDEESIIRSNGSPDDITITFTAAQKLRWNERIKKITFESNSVEDYVDGSFMGTISEPVGDIIQKHIVTDAIMSVDDYSAVIEKCQMELIQYISENTKGVHVLFIINFTAHFLQTILSTVYNIGDVAADLVPKSHIKFSGNDSNSFYA